MEVVSYAVQVLLHVAKVLVHFSRELFTSQSQAQQVQFLLLVTRT